MTLRSSAKKDRHGSTNSTESERTVRGPTPGRGSPVAVDSKKQYVISLSFLLIGWFAIIDNACMRERSSFMRIQHHWIRCEQP